MIRRRVSSSKERGYVAVTFAVSLFTFLSFFALVADLGHIYVTKAELQNTADSASLAAVVEIPSGETSAKQKALDFGQSHWVADSQIQIAENDIEFGYYNFLSRRFSPVDPDAAWPWGFAVSDPYVNAVSVAAKRIQDSPSGPLPLFFARLFGKEASDVQARAYAALDPHVVGVKGKNRLIPYSVIIYLLDQNLDGDFDIGSIIDIHPKTEAPGNFGFLDLDGGSNDIPELRQYIEEGYDKDFVIPVGGAVPVSGSPGIEGNSLYNSFKEIIGQVVFLPVHDSVYYEGSNAIFNVVGILGVRIEKVKLTGSAHTRFIRAKIISYASSVLVTNPEAPSNNSLVKPRLVLVDEVGPVEVDPEPDPGEDTDSGYGY